MSFVASQAARSVAGPSTTTLALVGIGTFCLANPEKALQLVQRALLALSDGSGGHAHSVASGPQPIVIHAGGGSAGGSAGSASSGSGLYYAILQLSLGAGLCWGSYVLLINVLPEQAKNMLPVTQGTFKAAVTSLGKGILHVKDSLSAEIANLLGKQAELADKQDETHEQVLYVQDQVADVHDDINDMQTSLGRCQKAWQTTDKRTSYIAKGIRLVAQGMTAILPPDDDLAKELNKFQTFGTVGDDGVQDDNRVGVDGVDGRDGREVGRNHTRHNRRPGRSGNNMNKPVVVIPDKPERVEFPAGDSNGSNSTTTTSLEELDQVRQLLESMEQHGRTSRGVL